MPSDLSGTRFSFGNLENLALPLLGSYQPYNAAVAITTLKVLDQRGWHISDAAIREGLRKVQWPGRFELLRTEPPFLLDGSHNPHGMRATAQSLQDRFPGQKFTFLISVMADKDVTGILTPILPLAKEFVTVRANLPRAMPAEELAVRITALGGQGTGGTLHPGRRGTGPVPGGRPRPGLRPWHPLLLRRRPPGIGRAEPLKSHTT